MAAPITWSEGDFFVLPVGGVVKHEATADDVDLPRERLPLLAYLGARPTKARFAPTLFRARRSPGSSTGWRARRTPPPQTVSPSSWATPSRPRPSRHPTLCGHALARAGRRRAAPPPPPVVALDFVIDCRPGCYTLLGTGDRPGHDADRLPRPGRLGARRRLRHAPGLLHSHHNESGAPASILPIQDAVSTPTSGASTSASRG